MRRGISARLGARLVAPIAVVLLTGLLVATAQSAGASSKVDARVARQMNANGSASFWILLGQTADLSAAPAIRNWTARGTYVLNRLTSVANASQRGLRAYLDARHVSYQAFWIVNGIRVRNASASVLSAVVARPEVARVVPTWRAPLIQPIAGTTSNAHVAGVEWGIKNIRANKVWKTGDRGQGTVVGAIDTGAQFTHPALVKSYRGNLGGGSFNHNYNWWDPSNVCGSPAPCDNVGHGTHTMGTMVGLDGANKIGVAPKAKWIEAKGCESTSCSDTALLSSGQFMLAPTRLDGTNPKPGKRPDVVNNSWSGGGTDTFYQSTVNAWVASGIFPQFANGNSGPSCGTVGAPGSYVNTYGAGAYDINNAIASFSSRGASPFGGEIKPNISAPGVDVRSSLPGNTYGTLSGTSMASPHVAGTVALIISAKPSLRGHINGIRSVLDNSAINSSNLTCGGTADDNNVFGEGRLDAFAAVQSALALHRRVAANH